MSTSSARPLKRDRGTLSLREVLVSGLPASLGSASPPEHYMVPAVFSRAPSPREIALIESSPAGVRLASAGYPDVSLKVSDRRLEIRGTNLEELRNGLAVAVARVVANATTLEDEEDATRLAAAEAGAAEELERARGVAAEAARISFILDDD